MTDLPQEHESLSAFIEKVEASGEDRKHAPFAWISAVALQYLESARPWDTVIWPTRSHESQIAIYTQQQLDDAVRAERERAYQLFRYWVGSEESNRYNANCLRAILCGDQPPKIFDRPRMKDHP